MAAYDSTVVAAVVLCGAMSTTSGKGKHKRGVTAADLQATRETVQRLQANRIKRAAIMQAALGLYKVAPMSPPAKRVKTKDPQEENRKRGKAVAQEEEK